jgi:hypothetical protein
MAGLMLLILADTLFRQSNPAVAFVLLVGCLLLVSVVMAAVYWTVAALKLNYHLNRNGLAIQWGLGRQLIPFNNVAEIVSGKVVTGPAKFRGLNLASLRLGWGELPEYGPLRFYTTAPLTDSLLIVTMDRTYVISPSQPQAFLQAWQAREGLGATREWREEIRRPWPLSLPVMSDSLTWWLCGSATVICLALLGYLSFRYASLPANVPLHFDNWGLADRIVDKSRLFTLPALGGLILSLNALVGGLVYAKEKLAAYLLWGSTILVQFCLWIAALIITTAA